MKKAKHPETKPRITKRARLMPNSFTTMADTMEPPKRKTPLAIANTHVSLRKPRSILIAIFPPCCITPQQHYVEIARLKDIGFSLFRAVTTEPSYSAAKTRPPGESPRAEFHYLVSTEDCPRWSEHDSVTPQSKFQSQSFLLYQKNLYQEGCEFA